MKACESLGCLCTPVVRQRTRPESQRPVFAGIRSRLASVPSQFWRHSHSNTRRAPHPRSYSATEASIAPKAGNQAGHNGMLSRRGKLPVAFLAALRAVLFYITTFIFATPLFGVMLAIYPYVLLFDKYR